MDVQIGERKLGEEPPKGNGPPEYDALPPMLAGVVANPLVEDEAFLHAVFDPTTKRWHPKSQWSNPAVAEQLNGQQNGDDQASSRPCTCPTEVLLSTGCQCRGT